MAKSTALSTTVSESKLAALRAEFPIEAGFQRASLPRIVFKSQDVTEESKVNGKKKVEVVTEAGTFLIEKQSKDAEDQLVLDEETGKPVWDSAEVGPEIEGVIVYQRKQLRYFDEATGSFTTSPIYDTDDEIIPLWRDKAEIDRGTPPELKAREEYSGTSLKGKPKSLLEDNRVLYILMDGELYQLNLRGSSMYSYMDYAKKARPSVPAVITVFNSEAKENGSVAWNQMTFVAKRPLTDKEADIVLERQSELKEAIASEKEFFAGQNMPVQNAELAKDLRS